MDGPRIRTIGWVDASGVLGHEERGFSRWLAEHVDLLADALGLGELTVQGREVGVGTFRIDILAVAEDDTEDGMPVVIENQYGRTNHDHLGKIVTYLAGQQRGLGVWVAESFSEPHVAAIEFLNRTSDESVGYALVTVRFAPAPDGAYYVDFNVVARPNDWLKATTAVTGTRLAAPERVGLLNAVHDMIEAPLREAGWSRVSVHGPRSARIELHLDDRHPLRPAAYFTLRASPDAFRFRHIAHRMGSFAASKAVIEAMRSRYGATLEAAVPPGTVIRWDVDTGAAQQNAQWQAEHPDGGHRDLTVEAAAAWSVAVAGAWVRILAADPPVGVIDAAQRGVAVQDV